MKFAFQLILVPSGSKYKPSGKRTFEDRKKKVVVVGLLLETNTWVCGS